MFVYFNDRSLSSFYSANSKFVAGHGKNPRISFINKKQVNKTTEVVSEIVNGVAPYLLPLAPWFLGKTVNMRAFSAILLCDYAVFGPLPLLKGSSFKLTDFERMAQLIGRTASAITVSDIVGLTPQTLPWRLAFDGIMLTSVIIGGAQAMLAGNKRLMQASQSKGVANKISNYISGGILMACGGLGLASSYHTSQTYLDGLKVFHELTPMQQFGVAKHRAIQDLAGEKTCHAVVIDGKARNWNFFDMAPMPFTESVYRNCKTRYYRVNSGRDFCASLQDATQYFHSKIDVLSINGHANPDGQRLGSEYFFDAANDRENSCMRRFMASTGQIFLHGCETAKSTFIDGSFAGRISRGVPGPEVFGHKGLLNPGFGVMGYEKGKFSYNNFFPFNKNGFVGFFNTIKYVGGKRR